MKIIYCCIVLTALGLVGCGGGEPPTPPLEGRWISDVDLSVLELYPDGRFLVGLREEPPVEITGTYTIDREKQLVTFLNDLDMPRCVGDKGAYEYEISDDRLIFRKVLDNCTPRERILARPFTRLLDSRYEPDGA